MDFHTKAPSAPQDVPPARAAYLAALESGDAEKIATTATAAGVSDHQAANDLAAVEKAKQLLASAARMPALKESRCAAKVKLDAAEQALRELQPTVNAARFDFACASRAESESRGAAMELLWLMRSCPEVLPRTTIPADLRDFFNTDVAEGRRAKLQEAREEIETFTEILLRLRVGQYPADVVELLHPDDLKRSREDLLAAFGEQIEKTRALVAELEAPSLTQLF